MVLTALWIHGMEMTWSPLIAQIGADPDPDSSLQETKPAISRSSDGLKERKTDGTERREPIMKIIGGFTVTVILLLFAWNLIFNLILTLTFDLLISAMCNQTALFFSRDIKHKCL